jgi:hypothetical protein
MVPRFFRLKANAVKDWRQPLTTDSKDFTDEYEEAAGPATF